MAILDYDVLVIDQVTSFMRDDFAIWDAHGQQVGHILTQGSALSRMFMGSRQLSVANPDGSPLLTVDDVPNFGRDTFDLLSPTGERFGEVVKEFTLFTKRLSVHIGQESMELQGSFFEREFSIVGSGGEAARVSRSYPGIGAALLGHERYVLSFSPDLPFALRAGSLGAVIALDLIRQKERNASSSAASGN